MKKVVSIGSFCFNKLPENNVVENLASRAHLLPSCDIVLVVDRDCEQKIKEAIYEQSGTDGVSVHDYLVNSGVRVERYEDICERVKNNITENADKSLLSHAGNVIQEIQGRFDNILTQSDLLLPIFLADNEHATDGNIYLNSDVLIKPHDEQTPEDIQQSFARTVSSVNDITDFKLPYISVTDSCDEINKEAIICKINENSRQKLVKILKNTLRAYSAIHLSKYDCLDPVNGTIISEDSLSSIRQKILSVPHELTWEQAVSAVENSNPEFINTNGEVMHFEKEAFLRQLKTLNKDNVDYNLLPPHMRQNILVQMNKEQMKKMLTDIGVIDSDNNNPLSTEDGIATIGGIIKSYNEKEGIYTIIFGHDLAIRLNIIAKFMPFTNEVQDAYNNPNNGNYTYQIDPRLPGIPSFNIQESEQPWDILTNNYDVNNLYLLKDQSPTSDVSGYTNPNAIFFHQLPYVDTIHQFIPDHCVISPDDKILCHAIINNDHQGFTKYIQERKEKKLDNKITVDYRELPIINLLLRRTLDKDWDNSAMDPRSQMLLSFLQSNNDTSLDLNVQDIRYLAKMPFLEHKLFLNTLEKCDPSVLKASLHQIKLYRSQSEYKYITRLIENASKKQISSEYSTLEIDDNNSTVVLGINQYFFPKEIFDSTKQSLNNITIGVMLPKTFYDKVDLFNRNAEESQRLIIDQDGKIKESALQFFTPWYKEYYAKKLGRMRATNSIAAIAQRISICETLVTLIQNSYDGTVSIYDLQHGRGSINHTDQVSIGTTDYVNVIRNIRLISQDPTLLNTKKLFIVEKMCMIPAYEICKLSDPEQTVSLVNVGYHQDYARENIANNIADDLLELNVQQSTIRGVKKFIMKPIFGTANDLDSTNVLEQVQKEQSRMYEKPNKQYDLDNLNLLSDLNPGIIKNEDISVFNKEIDTQEIDVKSPLDIGEILFCRISSRRGKRALGDGCTPEEIQQDNTDQKLLEAIKAVDPELVKQILLEEYSAVNPDQKIGGILDKSKGQKLIDVILNSDQKNPRFIKMLENFLEVGIEKSKEFNLGTKYLKKIANFRVNKEILSNVIQKCSTDVLKSTASLTIPNHTKLIIESVLQERQDYTPPVTLESISNTSKYETLMIEAFDVYTKIKMYTNKDFRAFLESNPHIKESFFSFTIATVDEYNTVMEKTSAAFRKNIKFLTINTPRSDFDPNSEISGIDPLIGKLLQKPDYTLVSKELSNVDLKGHTGESGTADSKYNVLRKLRADFPNAALDIYVEDTVLGMRFLNALSRLKADNKPVPKLRLFPASNFAGSEVLSVGLDRFGFKDINQFWRGKWSTLFFYNTEKHVNALKQIIDHYDRIPNPQAFSSVATDPARLDLFVNAKDIVFATERNANGEMQVKSRSKQLRNKDVIPDTLVITDQVTSFKHTERDKAERNPYILPRDFAEKIQEFLDINPTITHLNFDNVYDLNLIQHFISSLSPEHRGRITKVSLPSSTMLTPLITDIYHLNGLQELVLTTRYNHTHRNKMDHIPSVTEVLGYRRRTPLRSITLDYQLSNAVGSPQSRHLIAALYHFPTEHITIQSDYVHEKPLSNRYRNIQSELRNKIDRHARRVSANHILMHKIDTQIMLDIIEMLHFISTKHLKTITIANPLLSAAQYNNIEKAMILHKVKADLFLKSKIDLSKATMVEKMNLVVSMQERIGSTDEVHRNILGHLLEIQLLSDDEIIQKIEPKSAQGAQSLDYEAQGAKPKKRGQSKVTIVQEKPSTSESTSYTGDEAGVSTVLDIFSHKISASHNALRLGIHKVNHIMDQANAMNEMFSKVKGLKLKFSMHAERAHLDKLSFAIKLGFLRDIGICFVDNKHARMLRNIMMHYQGELYKNSNFRAIVDNLTSTLLEKVTSITESMNSGQDPKPAIDAMLDIIRSELSKTSNVDGQGLSLAGLIRQGQDNSSSFHEYVVDLIKSFKRMSAISTMDNHALDFVLNHVAADLGIELGAMHQRVFTDVTQFEAIKASTLHEFRNIASHFYEDSKAYNKNKSLLEFGKQNTKSHNKMYYDLRQKVAAAIRNTFGKSEVKTQSSMKLSQAELDNFLQKFQTTLSLSRCKRDLAMPCPTDKKSSEEVFDEITKDHFKSGKSASEMLRIQNGNIFLDQYQINIDVIEGKTYLTCRYGNAEYYIAPEGKYTELYNKALELNANILYDVLNYSTSIHNPDINDIQNLIDDAIPHYDRLITLQEFKDQVRALIIKNEGFQGTVKSDLYKILSKYNISINKGLIANQGNSGDEFVIASPPLLNDGTLSVNFESGQWVASSSDGTNIGTAIDILNHDHYTIGENDVIQYKSHNSENVLLVDEVRQYENGNADIVFSKDGAHSKRIVMNIGTLTKSVDAFLSIWMEKFPKSKVVKSEIPTDVQKALDIVSRYINSDTFTGTELSQFQKNTHTIPMVMEPENVEIFIYHLYAKYHTGIPEQIGDIKFLDILHSIGLQTQHDVIFDRHTIRSKTWITDPRASEGLTSKPAMTESNGLYTFGIGSQTTKNNENNVNDISLYTRNSDKTESDTYINMEGDIVFKYKDSNNDVRITPTDQYTSEVQDLQAKLRTLETKSDGYLNLAVQDLVTNINQIRNFVPENPTSDIKSMINAAITKLGIDKSQKAIVSEKIRNAVCLEEKFTVSFADFLGMQKEYFVDNSGLVFAGYTDNQGRIYTADQGIRINDYITNPKKIDLRDVTKWKYDINDKEIIFKENGKVYLLVREKVGDNLKITLHAELHESDYVIYDLSNVANGLDITKEPWMQHIGELSLQRDAGIILSELLHNTINDDSQLDSHHQKFVDEFSAALKKYSKEKISDTEIARIRMTIEEESQFKATSILDHYERVAKRVLQPENRRQVLQKIKSTVFTTHASTLLGFIADAGIVLGHIGGGTDDAKTKSKGQEFLEMINSGISYAMLTQVSSKYSSMLTSVINIPELRVTSEFLESVAASSALKNIGYIGAVVGALQSGYDMFSGEWKTATSPGLHLTNDILSEVCAGLMVASEVQGGLDPITDISTTACYALQTVLSLVERGINTEKIEAEYNKVLQLSRNQYVDLGARLFFGLDIGAYDRVLTFRQTLTSIFNSAIDLMNDGGFSAIIMPPFDYILYVEKHRDTYPAPAKPRSNMYGMNYRTPFERVEHYTKQRFELPTSPYYDYNLKNFDAKRAMVKKQFIVDGVKHYTIGDRRVDPKFLPSILQENINFISYPYYNVKQTEAAIGEERTNEGNRRAIRKYIQKYRYTYRYEHHSNPDAKYGNLPPRYHRPKKNHIFNFALAKNNIRDGHRIYISAPAGNKNTFITPKKYNSFVKMNEGEYRIQGSRSDTFIIGKKTSGNIHGCHTKPHKKAAMPINTAIIVSRDDRSCYLGDKIEIKVDSKLTPHILTLQNIDTLQVCEGLPLYVSGHPNTQHPLKSVILDRGNTVTLSSNNKNIKDMMFVVKPNARTKFLGSKDNQIISVNVVSVDSEIEDFTILTPQECANIIDNSKDHRGSTYGLGLRSGQTTTPLFVSQALRTNIMCKDKNILHITRKPASELAQVRKNSDSYEFCLGVDDVNIDITLSGKDLSMEDGMANVNKHASGKLFKGSSGSVAVIVNHNQENIEIIRSHSKGRNIGLPINSQPDVQRVLYLPSHSTDVISPFKGSNAHIEILENKENQSNVVLDLSGYQIKNFNTNNNTLDIQIILNGKVRNITIHDSKNVCFKFDDTAAKYYIDDNNKFVLTKDTKIQNVIINDSQSTTDVHILDRETILDIESGMIDFSRLPLEYKITDNNGVKVFECRIKNDNRNSLFKINLNGTTDGLHMSLGRNVMPYNLDNYNSKAGQWQDMNVKRFAESVFAPDAALSERHKYDDHIQEAKSWNNMEILAGLAGLAGTAGLLATGLHVRNRRRRAVQNANVAEARNMIEMRDIITTAAVMQPMLAVTEAAVTSMTNHVTEGISGATDTVINAASSSLSYMNSALEGVRSIAEDALHTIYDIPQLLSSRTKEDIVMQDAIITVRNLILDLKSSKFGDSTLTQEDIATLTSEIYDHQNVRAMFTAITQRQPVTGLALYDRNNQQRAEQRAQYEREALHQYVIHSLEYRNIASSNIDHMVSGIENAAIMRFSDWITRDLRSMFDEQSSNRQFMSHLSTEIIYGTIKALRNGKIPSNPYEMALICKRVMDLYVETHYSKDSATYKFYNMQTQVLGKSVKVSDMLVMSLIPAYTLIFSSMGHSVLAMSNILAYSFGSYLGNKALDTIFNTSVLKRFNTEAEKIRSQCYDRITQVGSYIGNYVVTDKDSTQIASTDRKQNVDDESHVVKGQYSSRTEGTELRNRKRQKSDTERKL